MNQRKFLAAAALVVAMGQSAMPALADAGHGREGGYWGGGGAAGQGMGPGFGMGMAPGMGMGFGSGPGMAQGFGPGMGPGYGMGMGGMMDPATMMRMHAMMSSMMGGGMMPGFGPGMMPGAGSMMGGGMMGGGMMGGGMMPGFGPGMMPGAGGAQGYGMMGGGMMPGFGPGMMPGAGGAQGYGMMGGADMHMLDADDDGRISPDEMDAGLREALSTYDADGSGTLSIAEFEDYHSALLRAQMVGRFQALDEDGDGQVTEAELAAPGRAMRRMMAQWPTQAGGAAGMGAAPGAGVAPGGGDQGGMGQGGMDQGGMMGGN